MDKTVLGLIENVTLIGQKATVTIPAKIDTGAAKSSIDQNLAAQLHLGPIIRTKVVKSASGSSIRPIIAGEIIIRGKRMKVNFTIAVRTHLKYKILIGQNILRHDFMIDPSK